MVKADRDDRERQRHQQPIEMVGEPPIELPHRRPI
jgi:hypothetical protein